MLKIATVLFTYNRPEHTLKVLEALRCNSQIPEKLVIFHDGIKPSTDKRRWDMVEDIIRNVDWCDCDVISSDKNCGLAVSVINGVNRIFKDYEAVIVLEDDCVPHPIFMEYMMLSLNKYLNEKRVYCIGATAEPVSVPENGYDAFFGGRIRSTGWATWRDRWSCFKKDYEILGRIKNDPDLNEWLNVWGQDLEVTLYNNIMGKVDSWAVFWALCVIEKKGLVLSPYHSLIDNIGFDNTGVHSGSEKPDLKVMETNKTNINLPDKIEIVRDYDRIFAWYFPWISPIKRDGYYKDVLIRYLDYSKKNKDLLRWLKANDIEKISIWGLGDLGKALVSDIKDRVEIDSIIETNPKQEKYGDIQIIDPQTINYEVDCILVVPGYDVDRIRRMVDKNREHLIVSINRLFEPAIPGWKADCKYSKHVKRHGSSYGGYYTFDSIIEDGAIIYSFGIGEDASFDQEMIELYDAEIYAFDPTPKSSEFITNHELNDDKRFHFFGVGLSDRNEIKSFYLPRNEEHVSGSEIRRSELKTNGISVQMKDLNSIAKELGHKHIDILKMDIEGSEFTVLDHLEDYKELMIDQICFECHQRLFDNGHELVESANEKLIQNGYVLVSAKDNLELLTYVRRSLIE